MLPIASSGSLYVAKKLPRAGRRKFWKSKKTVAMGRRWRVGFSEEELDLNFYVIFEIQFDQ